LYRRACHTLRAPLEIRISTCNTQFSVQRRFVRALGTAVKATSNIVGIFVSAWLAAGLLPVDASSCSSAAEVSPSASRVSPAEEDLPSGGKATIAGYLFAHMTTEDYGRLYYSISRDGLHWRLLNDGQRVLGEEYRGHPDICRGHDGKYYMLGNHSKDPGIPIWVSDDLVKWSKLRELRPDIWKTPDFEPALRYHGAPKIFFDDSAVRRHCRGV
jgi:hypothetical protein